MKTHAKRSARHRYTFGDNFPIRDATPEDGILAVAVLQPDYNRGVTHDPRRCANARALQRSLGLPPPEKQDMGLAIYRTVAYVPTPCPSAPKKWEVLRYYIKDLAHQKWDKGEAVEPQMVRLIPPAPNRRLDAKKQYRRAAGAPKRRPHKKIFGKPCGVRGGLYNHHQTQTL